MTHRPTMSADANGPQSSAVRVIELLNRTWVVKEPPGPQASVVESGQALPALRDAVALWAMGAFQEGGHVQ